MAIYAAAANGNFSAGATWAACGSLTNEFLDSEVGNKILTTSPVASVAFTPGIVTVDAIAVKFLSRAASPSGTITAELYNSTSSSSVAGVTINVSDIASTARYGWTLFKFASVTLLGATNYVIRLSTSNSAQISAYTDATSGNWARALRTTTTGVAPVAGDTMIICGERTAAATVTTRTVTYDVTASTSWGTPASVSSTAIAVADGGTMQSQTTASTAYVMMLGGNIEFQGNSTCALNSWGSGSTFALTLNSSGIAVVSAGTPGATCFGLILTNPAAFSMVGVTITTVVTALAGNAAAGATSITTAVSTGWPVGALIATAPTDQTFSHGEQKTLTSSSGTTLGFSALTNAHSGTSPTQAEVVRLDRSITIAGNSTNGGYILTVGAACPFTFQYVAFTGLGSATPFSITNSGAVPTLLVQYCSFYNMPIASTTILGATQATLGNLTIDSCVWSACKGVTQSSAAGGMCFITATSGSITFTNNVITYVTTVGYGFDLGAFSGTITGNVAAGCTIGFVFGTGANPTLSGNIAHSNSSHGVSFIGTAIGSVWYAQTITGFTSYHNAGYGFTLATVLKSAQLYGTLTFTGLTAVGNNNGGWNFVPSNFTNLSLNGAVFNSCVCAGDAAFAQSVGMNFGFGSNIMNVVFNACTFGVGTAHTTADIDISSAGCDIQAVFLNCNLASTGVEVVGQANLTAASYLGHEMWKQTTGSHRSHFATGTITLDTTLFNTASPSTRLTPNSASKLPTGVARVAVASGSTVAISVYIRRSATGSGDSASYTGAAPRLIQKASTPLGLASDVVLATSTASAGTWELLSATSSSVTDDGVLEFVVDCDTSGGWVNVDDWAAV